MGAAHCGSTLLDLILGSHSKGFSLGEMHYIDKHIDSSGNGCVRICGVCSGECSFWNKKIPYWMLIRQFSRKTKFKLLQSELNLYRNNFYKYLLNQTDSGFLVDSSKGPEWISRQLKPFYHWRQVKPILIYLCRDGRAVCNSLLRKYPENGMEFIARAWKRDIEERNEYFNKFPESRKIKIHYEEFASDPEKTTRIICNFLNIPFEPQMLQYWKHDHHPVEGGNLGTRSLIFKYRQETKPEISKYWSDVNKEEKHYSRKHYENIGLSIKPDFRWKNELSSEQLEIFNSIVGEINQEFAFPRNF